MTYDPTVVSEGQHAAGLLRNELRLRLAHDALRRVLRKNGTVRVADVRKAGFWDLLGDFWLCYGWAERRRLARAREFNAAFFDEAVGGAGYDVVAVDGVIRINVDKLRAGALRLIDLASTRNALAKDRRRDALSKKG